MTKKVTWYGHKVFIVLVHVCAWAVFILLPYFLRPQAPFIRDQSLWNYLGQTTPEYLLFIFIFYVNAYWLIPRLLNRKHFSLYILIIVATLVLSLVYQFERRKVFIGPERREMVPPGEWNPEGPQRRVVLFRRPALPPTIFSIIIILAASISYRLIADRIRADKFERSRETERLKSELGFLRSQISPHFIFNILNSVVSLSRTQPDKVESNLIKLSGLMRYTIYDAVDTKVPLQREIDYVNDYVALQLMRFDKIVKLDWQKTPEADNYYIEPMLLIPFVENAFKHGFGKVDQPEIIIRVRVDNGELKYEVKNKYTPNQLKTEDKYSGVGLPNVKKRLDMLYKDRYTLTILTEGQWHHVLLKLKLK